jgi:hypothetical protein
MVDLRKSSRSFNKTGENLIKGELKTMCSEHYYEDKLEDALRAIERVPVFVPAGKRGAA